MKRWLFKLGLFLFLGAVVNVAVAWGCQIWSSAIHEHSGTRKATDSEWKLLEKYRSPKVQGENSNVRKERGFGIHMTHLETYRYVSRKQIRYELVWLKAGWPYLSLHGEEWTGPVMGQFTTYWTNPINTNLRQINLPLQPIWLGFIANTIFYAAFTLLLTYVPKIVRRHIRYTRRRCLECGYDLRGTDHNKCPECGWGRETEA